MKAYKKWSPEQRRASLKITNKAKRMGLIPEPTKCIRCGQTKGIIQLHNEDYDFTLYQLPKYLDGRALLDDVAKERIATCLDQLCWTCHMIHHSEHRAKAAHDEYFRKVREEGFMGEPVYRHDWSKLKQYGI